VFTILSDGVIHAQIRSGTTVDDPAIARLLSAAGIPTLVERDRQSWLRTHAALVAPLMAMSVVVLARGSGARWGEAAGYARALKAGMKIARAKHARLLPATVAFLSMLPQAVLTGLFLVFW
ncbi:MAG TPA: ketopantoate reductase family protein, partial [Polyangiaceae bacterium]|nr:ketopantoate reductase family protein [Polyangiaceae bacterium]